ncbi:hypothetical protein CHS0354_003255 [Potamilus streckersoni]|uniref:C-type lectin domain-containing protein n=1 Tax=Potamilus streckersoni TaxID=2493646 RepID=A0AAE0SVH7_9BIVA|nr:hypothetical protein CHS0354_003255 [Potamilus streckersoni]
MDHNMSQTEPQQCDGGYIYNQSLGICYRVYAKDVSCNTAMASCEKDGAKLIIINNAAELELVISIIIEEHNDFFIRCLKMEA